MCEKFTPAFCINPDGEYVRAIDRSMTIEAILAIDKRFTR